MCGFCGVLNLDGQAPVDREELAAMTATLHTGAPTTWAIISRVPWAWVTAACPSSISPPAISPSATKTAASGSFTTGNFTTTRKFGLNLEKAGHRFATQSDTEVVVHAYEEYGAQCLKAMNGMFAFALWDGPRRRLLLARDRVGIKPLYYARLPQCLVFGSEVKALLAHPHLERRLDLTALNLYLSLEYVPTPYSIFAGVKKLPPGPFPGGGGL
jgi:asparagine synthase (glutamine-hydrolysing)